LLGSAACFDLPVLNMPASMNTSYSQDIYMRALVDVMLVGAMLVGVMVMLVDVDDALLVHDRLSVRLNARS
jgi:hypothetical protein